jgi:deaminated glutathione amidase
MRVALVQLSAGQDKEKNIARAVDFCRQAFAAGAKFVLLPEVFNWRGPAALAHNAAEKIPGPSLLPLMALARTHQGYLLAGSILEKSTATKSYNTSILINPNGEVAQKYRKIHLFDARLGDKIIRESDSFACGRQGSMAAVGDLKVGLSVCYDVRFPEMYRRYARAGAQVLTVPSCFTRQTGLAHWEMLLRARAIENLSYVLAPDQVGLDARGIPSHGHSMIISPWGEIIGRGSETQEEIIYGDIDPATVSAAREKLPGVLKSN